jgi:hypothetical protein
MKGCSASPALFWMISGAGAGIRRIGWRIAALGMFGVEAISPAPEGDPVSRRRWPAPNAALRIWNASPIVDKLIGRGRFTFIGFPLKIRVGTASPIRAVAMFP